MRKALLVALALGLSVAAIAPMAGATNPPETADIACEGAKKTVHGFKHAEHGKRAEHDKGCKTCHHKEEGTSCCKCHKVKKEGDAPALKDAMHKACQDKCHKPSGKGPTKCDGCHGK